jgi:hypothetical protein
MCSQIIKKLTIAQGQQKDKNDHKFLFGKNKKQNLCAMLTLRINLLLWEKFTLLPEVSEVF